MKNESFLEKKLGFVFNLEKKNFHAPVHFIDFIYFFFCKKIFFQRRMQMNFENISENDGIHFKATKHILTEKFVFY